MVIDKQAYRLRVADEVWIATALLHRQYPDRGDFSVGEIVRRAAAEKATGADSLRPGVQAHAYLHCVANREPNPGRYRMLVETAKGRRRLFRPGDPCHRLRVSAKDVPDPRDVPPAYRGLIDWYHQDYGGPEHGGDPILSLRGMGSESLAGEGVDAWVERLRGGLR